MTGVQTCALPICAQMSIAFSDKEKEQIQKLLRESAWECARTIGMKKTTVEQLTKAADISKGAFYLFYPSKEMLFFEVLEELHTMIYSRASEVLSESAALATRERAARMLLESCRLMEQSGMMLFWENDLPTLLRKLPDDVLREHYHDDETHIRALLEPLNPDGAIPSELVAATVRTLMLTISHKKQIGKLYHQGLETLVHGACSQLFANG